MDKVVRKGVKIDLHIHSVYSRILKNKRKLNLLLLILNRYLHLKVWQWQLRIDTGLV